MEPEIITEAQTCLVNNQGLIIEYAVNIAAALLTLLIGYIAANILSGGAVKVMQSRKLDTTDFFLIGRCFRDFTRRQGHERRFAVLEGGYFLPALGRNVAAFCKGFA